MSTLASHEVLQKGDQCESFPGHWHDTLRIGERAGTLNVYRRPIAQPAAVPTPDSHADLKAILDKEQTHVALVEENNRRRDETLALGQELTAARKQFADRNRDRLFVFGGRLIDTTGGAWVTKPVEVVS